MIPCGVGMLSRQDVQAVMYRMRERYLPGYEIDVLCDDTDAYLLKVYPIPHRTESIASLKRRWRTARASLTADEIKRARCHGDRELVELLIGKLQYLSALLDDRRPVFRIGLRSPKRLQFPGRSPPGCGRGTFGGLHPRQVAVRQGGGP